MIDKKSIMKNEIINYILANFFSIRRITNTYNSKDDIYYIYIL